VRVVDHLVQYHPRVRREAEYGAVDEGDAERRVGAGLDDVALLDVVAHVEDDGDTVADNGGAAGELGDMADDVVDARVHTAGLTELRIAGQCVDDVTGQKRAIGRGQRGVLGALKVVMQDELVVVPGKDQVDA